MPPYHHSGSSKGRMMLPLVIALLAGLSVLPTRWSGWVGQLSRLVVIPTGPLSGYVVSVTRSVLSPPEPPRAEELRLLEEQKQAYETLYLREREQTQRLREYIKELQQGLALNPDAKVQPLIVPVIGTSADLASGMLCLRKGTAEVDHNTVATTTGLQLVGRVTSTSGPACYVAPITRKGAGKLAAAVMTGEGRPVLGTILTPTGDGRLKGDVLRLEGEEGPIPTPEPGQLVRLLDDGWPSSSRMLIVGRIESVGPSPEDPLRPVIVVRPTLNIERVSEVVLRLQAAGEAPR